jgi:hypothetical protein
MTGRCPGSPPGLAQVGPTEAAARAGGGDVPEDMHLPNPVIRSHYRNGFIKQYVRDHLILRTEAATNNMTDYGVNKAIEHLPALRDKLSAIDDSYLDIQQDILETFVDRGQLQRLAKPSLTASQAHSGPNHGEGRDLTARAAI